MQIEVLDMNGVITLNSGDQIIACRSAASIDDLRDGMDGLTQTILPWRDSKSREGQVRRLAADKSIKPDLKRALMEHVASTKVMSGIETEPNVMVSFVSAPDWDLVEKLGDDFWDDNAPAGWLCGTTFRTEDGAVINCSNARFESSEARELAVRQIVADDRLNLEKRKEIAVSVGRTPVQF